MSSENSKTSKPHVLILNVTDNIDLQRSEKSVALLNLSISYSSKNIKNPYKKNKFRISSPMYNDKFELPEGSYSASDIQDYFLYILKKHEEETDNPSIRIYVNKIENAITFKSITCKNVVRLHIILPYCVLN